jgi:PKD repeat protein
MYDVNAGFNVITNGLQVNVSNTSTNAINYFWDFGDGTTSTLPQPPAHLYTSTGNYTITLIADNGCTADTLVQPVSVSATGISGPADELCIRQTNPEVFQISCNQIRKAKVYNAEGKVVRELTDLPVGTVSFNLEKPGLYLVVFQTRDGRRIPFRWVKH